MNRIKPIETRYNGYRFRSRLEARWAVFFDTLGVDYEYEPEGFELPNGEKYLPDFRLKCWGTRGDVIEVPYPLYVEVKGEMTERDAEKIRLFSQQFPVLVVGAIPAVNTFNDSFDGYIFNSYDRMNGTSICPFNYETIDGDHFAAYPAATSDGKFFLWGDDYNYIYCDKAEQEAKIVNAYKAARSARFEYGEQP